MTVHWIETLWLGNEKQARLIIAVNSAVCQPNRLQKESVMKVVELTAPRPDALRSAECDTPRPRLGEVLVRLRAASLNFLDIAVATGKYPISQFPMIPVTDGAGEVAELGEGVTGWTHGDKVIPHFLPFWEDGAMTPAVLAPRRGVTLPGSLAEYVSVPAASLVPMPAHLTWEQAATLPIAATTAWRAVRTARLGPGRTVLLLGTGGVSIFALQFAKAHGANVIITSSSDEKLQRAREMGADMTINYKQTPEWDSEALRLTDGRGADLVLETGGTETFPRSVNAAAMNGTVFVIGFLSGSAVTVEVLAIMEKELMVKGNNTGPIAALREAAAAMAAHKIVPVVDQTWAMADAADAYAHLAAGGKHFGKLALRVD